MNLSYRNQKNAQALATFWGKTLESKPWYEVKAQSETESEIMIYDVIGWPFNEARELVQVLNGMDGKEIVIRIASPGGDCFDCLAILNALQSHKSKIITRNESLAASAASLLMAGGKVKQAYKSSMTMIHNSWTFAYGNQYEMAETINVLSKMDENMVDIYADNSNVGKREIREMMRATTWMTAKEAKDKGFIDEIITGKGVKAQFDHSVFANLPKEFKNDFEEKQEPDIRSIEKLLRDVGGLSKNKAKALLARGWPTDGESTETDNETPQAETPKIEVIHWDDSIVARLTKNINQMRGI
jgi:ATP-dependent protease ClpP protease subunit